MRFTLVWDKKGTNSNRLWMVQLNVWCWLKNDFCCTSHCFGGRKHTDTMLTRFVVDLTVESNERNEKSLLQMWRTQHQYTNTIARAHVYSIVQCCVEHGNGKRLWATDNTIKSTNTGDDANHWNQHRCLYRCAQMCEWIGFIAANTMVAIWLC